MTWTASYGNKRRDPVNFNIRVDITYTDGTQTIIEQIFGAVDLTDAQIAEQARKRIRNVLEVGDTALAALLGGLITLPPDPVPDPNQQVLVDAQIVFQKAFAAAQVKALNDPATQTAYDNLQTAIAAVKP